MIKKITEKKLARTLRKKGESYNEILKNVNVSKSTLSLWLRDILLTENQQKKLIGRKKSRYLAAKTNQQARIELTKTIIEEAKTESKKLIDNNLFIAGLMLYWAEGTKRGQEMVVFSNSDSNMIILMMQWFRKFCNIAEDRYRIQIQIHDLLVENNVKQYWSQITGISQKQFHKLIIKKSTLGHRKNKLYYGTCAIRISDRNLFRKIMGWKIGTLQEFGLIDNYKIPK